MSTSQSPILVIKWKNPPVSWKLAATQLRSSSAKRRHQHVQTTPT